MFCKGGSVALWFPIPTFFGWRATDLQLSRDPERIPIDAKNLEYLRHLSAMINCKLFIVQEYFTHTSIASEGLQ